MAHYFKRKRLVINYFLLLTLIFLSTLLPQSVLAVDEKESQVNAVGFTYHLQFPDNQTDNQLGYYDLLMKTGQKQKLAVILTNPGESEVIVQLRLNGAKTNSNGVIEYANSHIKNDASLKFPFEELVTAPETVVLAPKETKQVDLEINMPEESFDGVIAGGLQMMRANSDTQQTNNTASQVINKYAYAVSIVLQENDKKMTPDLVFNRAYASQQSYHNTIFINFSNSIPTYINDMTVEAQIMKKGSPKVLYDAKKTSMRMAPNSFIDFPISMNNERMIPGEYTAHVLVTAGEQKWQWTEEFMIDEQDAKKFNERDVSLGKSNSLNWRFIILITGVVISLIVLAILIVVRLYNHQKKTRTEFKQHKRGRQGTTNVSHKLRTKKSKKRK